eukprot:13371876-Alexandrium_andersonii.AAC.1
MTKRSSWYLRRPCMVAAPASQALLAAWSRIIVERGSGGCEAGSRLTTPGADLGCVPWASRPGVSGCAAAGDARASSGPSACWAAAGASGGLATTAAGA